MAKKEVRTLTTQDLVDSDHGAIYVLNTTAQIPGMVKGGGDVFIAVEVGKSSRTVKVPRTWIPIEITRSVPRKNLLESAYFLEAVSKGLVTPIDPKDAKELAKQAGYKEELARLEEFERSVREASKVKGIGRNVTVSGGNQDDEEEDTPKEEVKRKKVSVVSLAGDDDDQAEPTVSAQFQAWVNELNGMDNEQAVRNEIRTHGELEEEEAQYMYENIVHPKIKARLAKALGRD